tara:strand:+ start:900 stop:1793 length:894 start_codon:yes stop_codon:yes gene_type:complete
MKFISAFVSSPIIKKSSSKLVSSSNFISSNFISSNFRVSSKIITKVQSVNPLTGIDLGIPLNILQNVFTNLHYGYDVSTFKIIILQFLIGYYTYGKDRYKDALEYDESPFETDKLELYEYLLKYKNLYRLTYDMSFLLISSILLFDDEGLINMPFILVLLTSEFYKNLKKNLPYLKPFYVATMWTMSTVILPIVMHDNNYDILNYPMDYIPCALTMFASTNLLDIKDIEEDKENGINTIPVTYGKYFTYYIALISLTLSSLIFGLNSHYLDRPLVNSLFEFQNVFLSVIPLLIENDN